MKKKTFRDELEERIVDLRALSNSIYKSEGTRNGALKRLNYLNELHDALYGHGSI